MAARVPIGERIEERQDVWVASRAITFDEYLDRYEGVKDHVELVKGVPTTRMAANIPHEKLFMWLGRLLGDYVEDHDLGIVLGSRAAVRITNYDGRLPDLLFVRKDRLGILEHRQLSEAPDLVIEIVSPGDRASHKMALEADYRLAGVREIVFIDVRRRLVQVFRREDSDYRLEELHDGVLRLETAAGLWLDVDWLIDDDRPPVRTVLARIDGET